MLTKEANERLTRIGPGTPMGNVMRRYWHPIATSGELAEEPVLAVKLLGENLVLYRSPNGDLGMVAERCPHRGASMAYGIPEDGGLRCPYHGWKFSSEGACLEQPAEPQDSTFKHRVRIPAYPVQELAGMIWAYLGPEPVPLLPRWDILVRPDLHREIGITRLPVNWLQAAENSMDPVHLEYLHGMYMNYVLKRQGKEPIASVKHHEKIGFEVFEFGIYKRRLLTGQSEDAEDWRVGHPQLFPATLSLGTPDRPRLEFRIPQDDEHTMIYSLFTRQAAPGEVVPAEVPIYDVPYKHEDGRLVVDTILGQDQMTWVTQGTISDRTTERLGSSDKGIILYRSVMMEQIERVERGEDPLGVIRDPAQNENLSVGREAGAHYQTGSFMPATDYEDALEVVRGKRYQH
ncbi:MAG: Rieske 2Fe-2S domain-containing protein [Chloroflexota bacterium]